MSVSILHKAPFSPSSRDFYKQYSHKSCVKKIYDCIMSILRDILYVLMIPYLRCTSKSLYARYSDPTWKKGSAGLVVLVHGLNGDPSIWRTHVKLLKQYPDLDIYVPRVHKQGNCPLESAVEQIFAKTFDYISKNPEKKVCLLGFSNGGRVVFKIDADLRQHFPKTHVKVSTIAAPILGTTVVNRISRNCLLRRFLDPDLQTELSYESPFAISLLDTVRTPLLPGVSKRAYSFYASTNDPVVPNLKSSLPSLGLGESHHIVHGYGHKSIVDKVARDQVKECISWFNLI